MIVNKTKLVNTGKMLVYDAASAAADSSVKLFMSDFVGYNKADAITNIVVKACNNLTTLDNLLVEDEVDSTTKPPDEKKDNNPK